MSSLGKKSLYIGIVTILTSTTLSASYWQYKRYQQSRAKWNLIAHELSKEIPYSINQLKDSDKFPLRYVRVDGTLGDRVMLVSRAREGRVGNLVVRALEYENEQGRKETILAVEGWIPQDYEYRAKKQRKSLKGILREKQKTDYIHQKMSQEDLQKYKVNTFIDIQKASQYLLLDKENLETEYYLEVLKDIHHSTQNHYPYQYSVDNFQLPYLTPDKHRAYSMFWGLTSCVGIGAILKVLKMK